MRKILFVLCLCAAAIFSVSCSLSDEELVFTENISYATYEATTGTAATGNESITGMTVGDNTDDSKYVITFSAYGTDSYDPSKTVNARVFTLTEYVGVGESGTLSEEDTKSAKVLSATLDVDSITGSGDSATAKYSGKDWEYKDVTLTVKIETSDKTGTVGKGKISLAVDSGANKTAISAIDNQTFTATEQ